MHLLTRLHRMVAVAPERAAEPAFRGAWLPIFGDTIARDYGRTIGSESLIPVK